MPPQNLLVIMSDEHNARVLGCAGHPLVQTPHLDALAARGTRFANASCNFPICVPSRASFLTGRYGHQIGAWDNAMPYTGDAAPSWGHRLAAHGRQVTTIGKLHYRNTRDDIGLPDQRLPMHVMHERGDAFGSIRWNIPRARRQLENVHAAGPGDSEYLRYDAAVADEACAWLRDEAGRHEQPWCLFVSFTLPHFPLIAPPADFARYPLDEVPLPIQWHPDEWPDHAHVSAFREARIFTPEEFPGEEPTRRAIAAYLGMCTYLDRQIGRVLDALDACGLDDRTRVIYTSDHGETLGDYGLWGKSVMYDSAVAVPLILAGPDVPAGAVRDVSVSLVDAFPTICEGVGAPLEAADADLPGMSLWPLARGDGPTSRTTFAEYHASGSVSGAFMLRDERWKYVHYHGFAPQLFDLANDPEERQDLAGDPAHAADLRRFEAQLRAMVDPEAVEAEAKAAQRRLVERNGGESAVRAAGPQINFTRAPNQFR
ncbi:MAG: sulfatase-like hydrolase/transferase [Chloroflexota bacterium]|nr:sulfatase-like hydrolase/transferase [Chloroflexota bacterium]